MGKHYTINKNLFFPVELYNTLNGSLMILKTIGKEKRSVTQDAERLKSWLSEEYKKAGSFSFLKGWVDFPFCIVLTYTGTYVARLYFNGKALPLREDGLEPPNIMKGEIIWASE